jgi:hypothetical protein
VPPHPPLSEVATLTQKLVFYGRNLEGRISVLHFFQSDEKYIELSATLVFPFGPVAQLVLFG